MSGRRRGTKQSFASISVSPSHYSSYNQEIKTERFLAVSTRSILVILKIKIFCSPDIVDIHKSGKIASLITVRVPVSTKRIDWSPPYTLIFNYFKGTNRFPPISKVQIDFHLFQNVHNDFHPFPKHNYTLIPTHIKMYTLISTLLQSTHWCPPFSNVHVNLHPFKKYELISTFFQNYTLISTPFKKPHWFHYFQNVRVDIHHSQKYTWISTLFKRRHWFHPFQK